MQTRPPLAQALVRPFSEDLLGWLVLMLDLALFVLLILAPRARVEATRVGLTIAWCVTALLLCTVGTALLVKSEFLLEGRAGVVLRRIPQPRVQPVEAFLIGANLLMHAREIRTEVGVDAPELRVVVSVTSQATPA